MHASHNFSVNSIHLLYLHCCYQYILLKRIIRVHNSSGKIEHLAKSLTFKNNDHHWSIVHKHGHYFQESFLIQHQGCPSPTEDSTQTLGPWSLPTRRPSWTTRPAAPAAALCPRPSTTRSCRTAPASTSSAAGTLAGRWPGDSPSQASQSPLLPETAERETGACCATSWRKNIDAAAIVTTAINMFPVFWFSSWSLRSYDR